MAKYTFCVEFPNGFSTPIFNNLEEAKKVFDFYINNYSVIYVSQIKPINGGSNLCI